MRKTAEHKNARHGRQWGAETSTRPLAIMHAKPSGMRIILGYVAMGATVISYTVYMVTMILTMFVNNPDITLRFVIEDVLYLVIVTTLIFSAMVYLVTRQGAMRRFLTHERVPRAVLDEHYAHGYDKGITVLIPSYVEQPKVVAKTIWSAALQEFPDLAVVLLIDDPPHPKNDESRQILEACRSLVPSILDELARPAKRFTEHRNLATKALAGQVHARRSIVARCADDYRAAVRWLDAKADYWPIEDHTDEFFCDQVLRGLARDLRQTEDALNDAVNLHDPVPAERIVQLYNRLVWIFTVKGWSFERKQYISLSQEGNKAMNLNSFIGLMGHRVKREETADGVVLRDVRPGEVPDFVMRDSEYVLTLDADSMLLRDYCIRLVYQLEQPGNEHVAVIQTPYSSYRGAPTRIERIAAATTDIQHVLHQGMTYYDATFWVGANAVIRKRALDDICVVSTEGTRTVRTYIQDRTVIEDTESSVDLGYYGWHLVNYPERLSYSSTPPDFGSLVVQRRRWANGGLLIIGKFFRIVRARRRQGNPVRLGEWCLRVNYMASIAWSSFGLLFLLAYPFDQRLLSPWVVAASLPYFITYANDLKSNGYKRTDIFRIYGFNIVLLTVNLAGTLKSIQQGMTNTKIPFVRTPKVSNRTASPPLYVAVPWAIVGFSCFVLYADYLSANWGNAIFAGFNAVVTLWALVSYIGIWHSIQDMVVGLVRWFFVPVKQPVKARKTDNPSWKDVLYFGDRKMIYESRPV
ncbi:glycosyltransferase family 2 protein [Bifidobacterium thermophilum]|uniref:Glycosyltransferase n=1 Tax=Bifidobacterium thermophilum TaxID=33905 RepID=A0A7X9NTW7_9BIFI|nr:glycosyltransferase family 2 protein [Bifidobacterium thermophilum]NME62682.1 glycosyltransferase [Bifidobacterium thermophilum]